MSNTYYCMCIDCEDFTTLKDGEEEYYKKEHYGHEILIWYYGNSELVHYNPEEKEIKYGTLEVEERKKAE